MTTTGTAVATAAGWDALLADGGVAHIRPVTAADGEALRALHRAASDRSIYLRYFSLNRRAGDQFADLLARGREGQLALVAEQHGTVVGVVSCTRLPGTADAEVALLVADAHQHRGVGTLLLEHLGALARHAGIRRFVADTLAANAAMQRVFTDAGFPLERHSADEITHVTVRLAPTEQAQRAVDLRERQADVASLRHVLAPRSVAVVGASDRPGSTGGAVLRSILGGGPGRPAVHPVNPHRDRVLGLPAYSSVLDLPEPVDLAVVAVPAAAVAGVVAECGQRGIPAAVVLSAGFGDAGPAGVELERELLRTAREAGVRLVGPTSLGVATTGPDVQLNATVGAARPAPGVIGLASQSGALGMGLLSEAARRHIGVSDFVSLGNRLDVSGNDLLLYWEDDPRTQVIALYVESFGNPAKFLRHAGRVARRKPVVALRAGGGATGAGGGRSRAAAAAGPDVAVSTLLREAGVIQVRSTEDLLDVAQLLSGQPVPAGPRLGVLGNSGGPGVLAADAAGDAGLELPELSAATQAALRAAAPGAVGVRNPVHLGAAAGAQEYEAALRVLLACGEVDAAVVVHAPPVLGDPGPVRRAVRRAAGTATAPRTVAVVLLGSQDGDALTDPADASPPLPPYTFPESAVRAIGAASRYGRWLRTPTGTLRRPDGIDTDAARAVAVRALAGHPDGWWLGPRDTADLLAAVGVPLCPTTLARSAAQAAAVARRLGRPVALKTAATLARKAELGAVRTGLRGPAEVRAAYDAVTAAVPDAGVLVQPMAGPGVELAVTVCRAAQYPPLLAVGLGGPAGALLGDAATRLVPVTDTGAREVLRELRCAPLLLGSRGGPAPDVRAVEDLLLRVSTLADEVPELAQLELDPVVVGPDGLLAVDAKARLAPVGAGLDLLYDPMLRRLR